MTPLELAMLLVDSPHEERLRLMSANSPLPAVELAESLQQMCYEVWTDDPQQVKAIVETLNDIFDQTQNPEVDAYAKWTSAIEALVDGDLETCVERINDSEAGFGSIGKPHLAAKTQTSKLYALALLGRYDEAVSCGLKALAIFVEHDDQYSAGKIEHNIGNLYWRRDLYRESEPFLESAHRRFASIGDERQLAMVENCQAFVKTLQNQFRDAEAYYERALERAGQNDLTVTEAEIETGLSNLYLFKGQYDLALKYLERSRQKFERLEMANQSAICELEIADIYLELSLLPEAIGFYERAEEHFELLGMQSELARSCLNHARALRQRGDDAKAANLLDRAELLYLNEGNLIAVASVRIARSKMYSVVGRLAEAEALAESAIESFRGGESLRLELFARWLRADIWRRSNRVEAAVSELETIIPDVAAISARVEYLCHLSLGLATGDETEFIAAIDLVENSRSMLASDDLKTSYFADKLLPYDEMFKIRLAQDDLSGALAWHERSRSRALADRVGRPDDPIESDDRLDRLRDDISWLHNRINRSPLATQADRFKVEELRRMAADREREYSEMLRRVNAETNVAGTDGLEIGVDEIAPFLDDTTVVEFAAVDGRITAFVIANGAFTAVPQYLDEAELKVEIERFLFQIKTGRLIERLSESNRKRANQRLVDHSQHLFELIFGPLAHLIKTHRLELIPAGLLNYLPFQALHDGNGYLAERFQISYAPSLRLLHNCLVKPDAGRETALIVGVADETAPMIEAEVDSIAALFHDSRCLTGPEATVENIKKYARDNSVIHFACHGNFRPDNPSFSSIALFTEVLSVNYIYQLSLENSIIVLSACESGLNEVVRGEELIGLTRAFFGAGASTLLLSLWRVNDDATLRLMRKLYSEFCGGLGLASALRNAQLELIKDKIHPYFWSPFIISGKW